MKDKQAQAPVAVLLRVRNRHSADCGTPPEVVGGGTEYVGYFENPFGEQAVYQFDHCTGTATLRMGDLGWEQVRQVVDGRVPGVVLGQAEQTWLQACWLATGGARGAGGKA